MESDRQSVASDSTGISGSKPSTATGAHTRRFGQALTRPGQAKAAREAVATTLSQPNPAVSHSVHFMGIIVKISVQCPSY